MLYTYDTLGQLIRVDDENELHFYYSAQGKPSVAVYNGTPYSYVKNLQGDIVAIFNSAGTVVVSYVYGAWGRPIATTGSMADTLGVLNPFRYRGYVFDEETAMYYLRSRYYHAINSRFFIQDSIQSGNGYSYCNNSPTVRIDSDGKESKTVYVIGAYIIGGIPVTEEQYYEYRKFMDEYGRVINLDTPVIPPFERTSEIFGIQDVKYRQENKTILTLWGHVSSIAESTSMFIDYAGDVLSVGISSVTLVYTGYYLDPSTVDTVIEAADTAINIVDIINFSDAAPKTVDHTHIYHELTLHRFAYFETVNIFSFEECSIGQCVPEFKMSTLTGWLAIKHLDDIN